MPGGRYRYHPGIEHPVVVGEAETQQGPFTEACGRRPVATSAGPVRTGSPGEADNSSRNTSRGYP
ncbi:MAG: hypothetical protein ACLSB7_03830 [Parabacteroides distasonis]